MKPVSTWAPAVILILLSLMVMGFNLGSSSLHNQDEAKHAVVAREAATQGDWLSLRYNGRPYFSKPPLRIWLTAISFKTAGVNEWSVRFWSAMFGLGTVLALYLIGRRIYGERTAFLSALILLTSHQYIYNHCVRTGETDSMLIFSWTCGMLLLQLATDTGSPRVLLWSAGFLGLCGMVKHLGFIPIVLVVAIGYVTLARVWRRFPLRVWAASLGVLAAVALPWHVYQWLTKGPAFFKAYFLGEVIEKRLEATGGGPSILKSGPWSSILTLSRGFFPWSCLLPFAIFAPIGKPEFRRRWLMPTLWFAIALGTTVISGRKFTWYVLPAFPAAALLVAGLLDRFLTVSSPLLTRISVAVGALLALTSYTNVAFHNPFDVMARQSMLAVRFLGRVLAPAFTFTSVGILLTVIGALGILVFKRPGVGHGSQRTHLVASYLVVAALAGLALYTVVVPLKFSRTLSPLDEMAQAADTHLGPQETLIVSLPGRKAINARFQYYFGAKNHRRLPVRELSPQQLSGRLILTNVATLEQIRDAAAQPVPPMEPLVQSRGMILVRWPEG